MDTPRIVVVHRPIVIKSNVVTKGLTFICKAAVCSLAYICVNEAVKEFKKRVLKKGE